MRRGIVEGMPSNLPHGSAGEADPPCAEWNEALSKVLSGINDLKLGQARIHEYLMDAARFRDLELNGMPRSPSPKGSALGVASTGLNSWSGREWKTPRATLSGATSMSPKVAVRIPGGRSTCGGTEVNAKADQLEAPQIIVSRSGGNGRKTARSSMGGMLDPSTAGSLPMRKGTREASGKRQREETGGRGARASSHSAIMDTFRPSHVPSDEEAANCKIDGFKSEGCNISGDEGAEANGESEAECVSDYAWSSESINAYGDSGALPTGWPRNIPIRAELKELAEVDESLVIKAMSRTKNSIGLLRHGSLQPSLADEISLFRTLEGFDPNSSKVMGVDLTGFVFLMFDLVMNPFVVAWNVQLDGPLAAATVLSAVFWLVDMVFCFLTGFHKDGEIVLNVRSIAIHYIKTWWPFDVVLCLVDWVNVVMQIAGNTQGSVLLRVMRMLKILKLCRAGRLVRLMEKLQMHACNVSDSRRLLLKAIEVIFCTFLTSHILTCAWFAMGKEYRESSGESWLHESARILDPSFTYHQADMIDQYLTALHWTVAQLTLGSSDVMPANSLERTFNVALLMLGLLFGSTVVSLFSAQIVQIMMSKLEKRMKLDQMRLYLQQHNVSHRLSVQVMAQTVDRLKDREVIRTEDVAMLPFLSKTLRYKLMYETCLPHLLVHPLFEAWAAMDTECMLQLCREAVSGDFINAHMEVFLPGSPAACAYYIQKGCLDYFQPLEYSPNQTELQERVNEGAWLCEAALWSQWMHVGSLTTAVLVQVVTINADIMWQVLRERPEVESITATYCRNFHTRIEMAGPPHSQWPNDVHVPFTDPRTLLASHVGVGLLHRAIAKGRLSLKQQQVDMLKTELREEKCALEQNQDGTFCRVVYVEAIKVEIRPGLFLAQVGTWEDASGKISAKCGYPAKKRARAEMPQGAVKRLLEEELEPLNNSVTFTHRTEEMDTQKSFKYGLSTIYHRTVHIGSLQVDPDDLDMRRVHLGFGREGIPEPIRDIVPTEVLFLPTGAKQTIYAWLDDDCFDILRSPAYEDYVKEWLTVLMAQNIRHENL